VFIDFWNFQLSLNHNIGRSFKPDWRKVGPVFASEAGALVAGTTQGARIRFDGMHVYLSYNPSTDARLKHWALNTLDRFPGVQVNAKARKPKGPPKCPSCYQRITGCPNCGGNMRGTVEKGVDTAIVTDMIRHAWEDAYDVAVLASSDADFIPAVQFLDNKGRRVIQAGFPPRGVDLARACWASIDVKTLLSRIER